MQPLSKDQYEFLKGSGQFAERLANARAIGNHQIDTFRMRQALLRTARRYYQAQGLSEAELDLRAPVLSPPIAWGGMPTVGKVKLFALLIEFNDAQHSNTTTSINNALFGTPLTGAPYESLHAYYNRASYGKLDFSEGDTLAWYKINKNKAEVPKTLEGREAIIKEALLYHHKQGVNFKEYDNNGDGVVDYFMVFWTGTDDGWGSFWWGYYTHFTDSTFKLDNITFNKYSWQWEAMPLGSAFDPRVVIHETGHALGLPDLYDYDSDVGPDGGVGEADMMDYNQYDHNCFSKWVLDWLEPTIIASGTHSITLKSSGKSKDCVVIWPGIEDNNIFSEFFIIQNRQVEANDSDFPGSGLMIWHVDASLNGLQTNYTYNNQFTDHKLVRLMEADGEEHIEKGIVFTAQDLYKEGKMLGPDTTPSSSGYSRHFSGIYVKNIIEKDNEITATFSFAPYLFIPRLPLLWRHYWKPIFVITSLFVIFTISYRYLPLR